MGFCTKLVFRHNSLDPEWGVMSNGWSHNYHIYVIDGATGYNNNQDNITFVSGDGRRVIFRYNATSSVHLADSEYGVFSKIARETESSGTEWVHSKYKLTMKSGLVITFRGNGKIDKMEDPNSNTLEFHYSGDSGYSADSTHPAGALVEIEDSLKGLITSQAGRKSKFTYNSDRQIATVQDPKASSANYSVSYDSSSKRLSGVSFTGVSGVQWTFTYHTSNHTSNGYRLGMLDLIRTPRGTAAGTPYGTSYRWYQDNRLWKATDPSVSVVTNESADASPTSDTPVRLFEYTDPTSTFSTPNQAAPGSNTVPITVFSDRRGYDTTIECQYRRALVDNVTDPMSESAIYTHDGTYRNLTEAKDKRGYTIKYTYHTSATPSWVRDNLWKIERPNSDGSGYLDPIIMTYTTDGLNRIASREDARGNETTYDYDAYGNLETTTYPTVTLVTTSSQTASESWTYTTRGRVETHTLPEGGVTTYHYDDDDDTGLVTQIQEDGQDEADARAFEYDDMGNLTEFTASPNNLTAGVTGFTLDGLYRVTTVTDPLLETTVYVFDADSNVTSVTNRRGKETTHAFNVRNERTSTTKPYGSSQTATAYFDYDRSGNLRKTTNFRGYTSWQIYDADGRVIETHQQGAGLVGGGGSTDHERNFEYDENGNLTELTSVSTTSRVTTYTYDARNNRTQVSFPVGSLKEEFVYDANDNLLATNGKDGSTFKYGSASVYDERNRVIEQYRLDAAYTSGSPSGPVTSILHDKNGNVKQFWNANASSFGSAQSKAFTYDDRNRRTQVIDGTGTVIEETTYYENDSVHIVEGQDPAPSAGGQITIATYEYSKRGEMTEFKDALNYDWVYEYDDNGNRTKSTNPGTIDTTYAYDDADRLVTVTVDPTGLDIVTSHAYDAQGNLTSTTVYNPATSSNNAVYARAYDKADRLEKLTNPNTSNYRLWTYNDHGEVATHRDANAKTVTFTYDALGRVTSEAHGSPFSVTITRTYYAATSLATEIDDATREIVNTFNVLLELTDTDWSVSSSAFKSLSLTYDDAGNRDEMIDPEGAISGYSYTYKYVYDDDNRLWKVKRGGTDEAVYLYDASSRVKEVTLGNGSKISHEYTDRYQTSKVKTATSGGTTRAEYTYTYDSRMRCTQQVRSHLGETIDYGYDAANRLTSEESTGSSGSPPITVPSRDLVWAYDDAGNRETQVVSGTDTTSYTYNSESLMTQETRPNGDVYDYTYDSNGNRTNRDFTPNGEANPTIDETFGYDHSDRLSSYVNVQDSLTTASWSFSHVPTGQRISKSDLLGNVTLWYFSDYNDSMCDYSQTGSGSITHAVSYLGARHVLGRYSSSGSHYYVFDAGGSVTHLLSSAQAIANSEAFDSWGNAVADSMTVADDLTFNGLRRDVESGQYHDRQESNYDPRIGRETGTRALELSWYADTYTLYQEKPDCDSHWQLDKVLQKDTDHKYEDTKCKDTGKKCTISFTRTEGHWKCKDGNDKYCKRNDPKAAKYHVIKFDGGHCGKKVRACLGPYEKSRVPFHYDTLHPCKKKKGTPEGPSGTGGDY